MSWSGEVERYFRLLMNDVVEEEKRNAVMTTADEEKLFRKVSFYLKNPNAFIGIFTLSKLAFAPYTIDACRLEEIAGIICEKVFQPVEYTDDQIMKYTDFCICFAYLQGKRSEERVNKMVAFEQIVTSSFLSKLAHRFTLKGPQEKCIGEKTHEEKEVLKLVDKNSVSFVGKIQQVYPDILFKVLEFLLENLASDTYVYLLLLLEPQKNETKFQLGGLQPIEGTFQELLLLWAVTDVTKMISLCQNRFREHYLLHRMQLASHDIIINKITSLAEQSLKEHVNLRKRLSHLTTFHRRATPHDFIKLAITSKFRQIPRFGSKNDFEIDDEMESDYRPEDLVSVDYSSDPKDCLPHNCVYEWRGFRVKLLV